MRLRDDDWGLTNGADDQIQRPLVSADTLLDVGARGDILGRSQLDRILLLVVTSGDGGDLGTHLAREDNSKVPESTDSDDTDPFRRGTRSILKK